MNNEIDYALSGAKPISGMMQAGEMNAVQMGYSRRRSAATRDLDYRIQWTDNLLSNAWSTTEAFEAGAETINESFEIVTNRVPAGRPEEFVRLKINRLNSSVKKRKSFVKKSGFAVWEP